MKTKWIIGLCAMLCGLSYTAPDVHAKKGTATHATHMWIQTTRETIVYVPVRTVEQCEMLTKQAATLNSAQSKCFSGEALVKELTCTKSTHSGRAPSCS